MRTRFAVVCGLVAACAVAAFLVPAALSAAHSEREGQFVELQQEAADAAARSSLGDLEVPAEVRRDDPRRAAKLRGEDEHQYGLYDATGRRTAGEGPARLEVALAAAAREGRTRASRVDDDIVVAVPLAGGGALRAAEPAREADDRVQAVVTRLAGGALAMILLALAVAWLVAGRLVRPLEAVAEAAGRIGDGDVTAVAPTAGIREVDQVAGALNASAERIDALLARERRLTADTSHQLRTPLAGLRLTLEGELSSPGGNPAHIIQEALGAVDRLERTVADLTTLARGDLLAEPFDTRAALEDARARWAGQFRHVDRPLHVSGEGSPVAQVRRPGLDTVLDVLIDNALHHGRGAVQLHTARRGDRIAVSVVDEGTCHRSEEELFVRSASGAGSTGIGLDLARGLARAERGTLQLTSVDPTTFTLELPTAPT